jgi:hypothetical protein
MFYFLFKEQPETEQSDPELELARLALQDRMEEMLARDVRRKLRFSTIATPLTH